jgi:hypothetical protein
MTRAITITVEIELIVSDDSISFNNADDRLGQHIWNLDPEETGLEVASVFYVDGKEETL